MTAADFEDDQGGSPSSFSRWLIPALILSLLLHGYFWFWARGFTLSQSSEEYYERVVPRTFHLERADIDEKLLEPEPADEKRVAMAPQAVALPEEKVAFEKLMAAAKGEPAAPKIDQVILSEKPSTATTSLDQALETARRTGAQSVLEDSQSLQQALLDEKPASGDRSLSNLVAPEALTGRAIVQNGQLRGGDTPALIPCKTQDGPCRQKFLRTFGAKAFRRPLLEAEFARYEKLFLSEKSFLGGAQLTLEAMLQSPNFLLRTENGAEPSWRPYETASRLSYALWNSMPDAELLSAAARGELNTREAVEKQARRLLASPRAKVTVDEFVAEWLRFDQLLDAVKERSEFPMYSAELTVAMTEETRRMVADLVWRDLDFTQLFSAEHSFINTSLALLYKLPAPKNEYDRVALPAETGRAGILGQAMFLSATSKPADTSVTQRGLFVREHFLCQEVPQPPPGVNANLPNLDKGKPMTNRERLAMHLNNESCASCHTLVDPIGLGLEKYDAIGQFRPKQKLTFRPARKEDGDVVKSELDIDTSGYVSGIANSTFSTPRELGKILAAAPQCQQCVAKQLFRYYTGRHENARDAVVIDRAFADFRSSGFHFRELMVSLLKWSVFPPES